MGVKIDASSNGWMFNQKYESIQWLIEFKRLRRKELVVL